MDKLTIHERKNLLVSAMDIHTYKSMLSIAFAFLSSKAIDNITRNQLKDISVNESNDADDWHKTIDAINEGKPNKPPTFLKQRVRLMMLILGPRNFLEWALIAEDESLEDLAIKVGNIQDKGTSDNLIRIISDERLHVTKMKKEVLGMESWEMGGGGGVRDVIFGANDGLVSILALVAGVYGAVSDSKLILITGIAGAIAGTISMGAGAYLSAKSEREVTQKENQRKGVLVGTGEQKKASLIDMYQKQGFSATESEAVAERVLADLELKSQHSIGEVTGLTTEDDWPPSKAGLLTGFSFLLFSIVPILPFAFLEVTVGAATAMIASMAALFALGASKAVFTRSSWARSGIENLIIGVLAAAATYIIGILIPGV
jgi:VIT1/CCC1 family predicted Fe2+/Mn2+ transporter